MMGHMNPVRDNQSAEEPVETSLEGNADEIAALAYTQWEQRGCPVGSAEEDWYRAEKELASKTRDR
jgi:hydroxyethylthiazole kinase-like sugar kinase family protein